MAEQRKRFNAKQTAKGEYYFDVTIENTAETVSNDLLAGELLRAVQEVEKQFKQAGYKIVEIKTEG